MGMDTQVRGSISTLMGLMGLWALRERFLPRLLICNLGKEIPTHWAHLTLARGEEGARI